MREILPLFAFNRGKVSPLAMARIDQKRVALSAETMTNWIPRVLGPMSLRPGWQYLLNTASNAAARYLKFIFATTDTALIELTNGLMRVVVNDALVSRVSVSSSITNGTFDANLTGWTDADDSGGASAWVTGGYMGLTGDGSAAARRRQQVTVAAGDLNKQHALRIVINRGPVTLRVGSALGGDEYINETTLYTGTHSLTLTPAGNFHIEFSSRLKRIVLVDSIAIEAAGTLTIPTPWTSSDLSNVRYDQSGDVIFVACAGKQQRRIERRSGNSWSVVTYTADDGPFSVLNTGPTTITPSAISGNITLTASESLFRSTQIGALFKITSTGQTVTKDISAEDDFSNPIRITGIGSDRTFTIDLSNTWTATVTLQRSIDSDVGPWSDVSTKTWTANTTETYADGLDNQIVYYRIGIKTGDYTSGTVTAVLVTSVGSITGIVRLTGVTTATSASAEVIEDLGGTTATADWYEGRWSDYRGWPTAVRFAEGRLWWSGKNGIWGSVSDAFDSFDDTIEGDSGPISRTIGAGPVDTINWILALQRIILGAQGAEFSVRSSSLDEPITPTNFQMKPASTQGSAAVEPARIDHNGIYVQRSGIKVYELGFDVQSYDYGSKDLTALVPELGSPGIVRMDVQRQPDTRIHAIRSDGTVMMGIFDRAEDVIAWFDITTDGLVEDVVTLPGINGSTEDQVYYVVSRTINGSTVRFLEKWAMETECRGSTLNKQADAFVTFTNAIASTTVSGLSHLVGESVVVWQDGICPEDTDGDPKTYTVSGSGTITLDTAATTGVVGLPYTAQWKSTGIGLQASVLATTLNQQKRLSHLGLKLAWVHAKGLKFGPDFDHLDDMPMIEQGTSVSSNAVRTTYDEQEIEFPGVWLTDLRLCLQAQAPRPVTALAVVPDLEIHN